MPNNAKVNPREHINVITLKSEKELIQPRVKSQKLEGKKMAKKQNDKQEVYEEVEKLILKFFSPNNPPTYIPPIPYP